LLTSVAIICEKPVLVKPLLCRYQLVLARPYSFSPLGIELGEKSYVIRQSLNAGMVKLKGDTVALLYQTIIYGICFPKPTHPVFVIVAMLTMAMIADKNLFDVCRSIFDIGTMFINGIEEQAKYNTIVSNVNPSKDLFALYPRPRVNNHIPSPTITATNLATKIVSKFGHCIVEGENKPFITVGDKVKAFFL